MYRSMDDLNLCTKLVGKNIPYMGHLSFFWGDIIHCPKVTKQKNPENGWETGDEMIVSIISFWGERKAYFQGANLYNMEP